jgi:hypothetical protein
MLDLEALSAASKLRQKERSRWYRSCAPKDYDAGYHVHFAGSVREGKVRLSIDFIQGSIKQRADEAEPFAETFIAWLDRFVHGHFLKTSVWSQFNKVDAEWRSRFNLPFKVTMIGSDKEVTIDGISLILPENPAGAKHGWLTKTANGLAVAVQLERILDLRNFDLHREVRAINDSIGMFAEEIKK